MHSYKHLEQTGYARFMDRPNHLEHLPIIWTTGFWIWNRSLVLRAKRYKYLVLLKPLPSIMEGGLFCESSRERREQSLEFLPIYSKNAVFYE